MKRENASFDNPLCECSCVSKYFYLMLLADEHIKWKWWKKIIQSVVCSHLKYSLDFVYFGLSEASTAATASAFAVFGDGFNEKNLRCYFSDVWVFFVANAFATYIVSDPKWQINTITGIIVSSNTFCVRDVVCYTFFHSCCCHYTASKHK